MLQLHAKKILQCICLELHAVAVLHSLPGSRQRTVQPVRVAHLPCIHVCLLTQTFGCCSLLGTDSLTRVCTRQPESCLPTFPTMGAWPAAWSGCTSSSRPWRPPARPTVHAPGRRSAMPVWRRMSSGWPSFAVLTSSLTLMILKR